MGENIVDPSVEVCLDGQNFILRYRALAFIEYAAKCNSDLLNDVRGLGASLTQIQELAKTGDIAKLGPMFAKVRDILWAGLVDAQPSLTRDDVSRLFSFRDFQPLMTQISAAIVAGLPEVRPTKPAPSPRRRSSGALPNGGDSGQSTETPAESPTPNSAG